MPWITGIACIFILSGLGLLLAAGPHFLARRAFLRDAATATGTVVALHERREGEQPSYFPEVRFLLPSGLAISFQSALGSSQPPAIGQTVRVRYRPEQPHSAEIASFWALWGRAVLLGALGGIFLGLGLGILSGALPLD